MSNAELTALLITSFIAILALGIALYFMARRLGQADTVNRKLKHEVTRYTYDYEFLKGELLKSEAKCYEINAIHGPELEELKDKNLVLRRTLNAIMLTNLATTGSETFYVKQDIVDDTVELPLYDIETVSVVGGSRLTLVREITRKVI